MNREYKLLIYIYSVRIYTALVTIFLIPILIGEIGLEAYGLIGFFAVLQACLSILDAG
ncbi:O10 family O-antigen flippase, partial [Escherichia coli]|nr:O10 family O-antigen flippase [Escherichia coli]